MNKVTSFVLYALVGRKLGAHEFGQLSLAITVFYIFQVLAATGLKTLTIRQVAKDRSQTRRYFMNGCLIVTFSSLASLTILYGFVRLMQYPPGTTLVILLLSLALFPYAISAICEGLFERRENRRGVCAAVAALWAIHGHSDSAGFFFRRRRG
jgi:O-antigen/teichoic acid export membrane protein